MKKKIFAMYALIGAMAVSPIFTSCVDSEETDSVVALRNSKAEELKAIADLNNATAASKTAMAAADAALINARAEAAKAQARLAEAQAAYYEAQNEEAKVELEKTIKQAEFDLVRIQGEIDKLMITLEEELINVQKNLLDAQKDLDEAIKDYNDYEKGKLQALANEYSTAVTDLEEAKLNLIVEKKNLAKLETGLVDAKELLEKTIAANNNQIALNNIKIETMKQYADYEEDFDKLSIDWQKMWDNRSLILQKQTLALYNWNQAKQNLNTDDVDKAWEAITEDPFYNLVVNDIIYDEESEQWLSVSIANYIAVENSRFIPNEYSYVASTGDELKYSESAGSSFSFEYKMTKDIRELELEALNATSWQQEQIKLLNEQIKTDQTTYEAAVKATADAKKAWDEAAEADKDAKKQEYETALYEELDLKSRIENAEQSVASYTKEIAFVEEVLEMAKNAETLNAALQEKITAYNEAVVAAYAESLTTWEQYMEVQIEWSEFDAEYWAFGNHYWNSDNIKGQIESLETQNETLLEEIAKAEKLLTSYEGIEMPYEVAIEFQKQVVAVREALVAVCQVKVDEAKAALDAAMPAEEE